MNSLVKSAKLNTAVYRYNKRVCECRLALHVICKNLGIESENWKILKELQDWSKLQPN